MIFPGFPGTSSFFQVFQVEWEPWSQHAMGRGVQADTPPLRQTTPLPKTATEADRTHPTGILSCSKYKTESPVKSNFFTQCCDVTRSKNTLNIIYIGAKAASLPDGIIENPI